MPPKTPAAAPSIAPVTPVEAITSQTPISPASQEARAANPVLNAPQNNWVAASPAEPTPQPEQTPVQTEIATKQADNPAAISPNRDRAEDPAVSNRVEEHLLNNLRL
jgi:hypothetical protein